MGIAHMCRAAQDLRLVGLGFRLMLGPRRYVVLSKGTSSHQFLLGRVEEGSYISWELTCRSVHSSVLDISHYDDTQ
jgi:hypothetical protein